MKTFKTIYKYSTKGKAQQWTIVADRDEFYTISGQVGGKLTTSKPTTCTGKNIGKSNETTPEQQALAEAAAKHQKKLDEGYSLKISKKAKFFAPMLAECYKDKDTGEKNTWIDELVWNSPTRKFIQPKLDGLRGINTNNTLNSRNGKPFVTCPHLLIDGDVILDGELYNHEFKADFNAIVSMIKQPKASAEDLAHAKKWAQMWVYDMPSHPGTFFERYKALRKWFEERALSTGLNGLVLVPTFEVFNEEDFLEKAKEFRDIGYEGAILRLDELYENKRTKSLLKYKDFIDEEFEILGYEEGKGGRKGTIGKFILKHDKDPKRTFKSNVKGDLEYLKQVWNKRDTYIGKSATVEYFNRTPAKEGKGDVPRHGYVIKIDRESYE